MICGFVDKVIRQENKMALYFRKTIGVIIMTKEDYEEYRNNVIC